MMQSLLQMCCYFLNIFSIKSIHTLQNFSLLRNNYYRYNCFINEINYNKIKKNKFQKYLLFLPVIKLT